MTRKTWADSVISNALNDPQPLLRELDAESNELAVRERLASGKYNNWQSGIVEEWLRQKIDERQAELAARVEAREEETLSIAREANRIASRAERWAMYAAIAAVIALIISMARSNS